MTKPFVLHISTAKTWRGGEQQVAYLMQQLRKKNIKQHVFCVENGAFHQFAKDNGFETTGFKKGFSFNPLVALKLSQLSKKLNVNLIHTHDSHAHTFAVLANALWGMKRPLIVSRRVDFPIGKSAMSMWKYKHPSVGKILCVSDMIRKIVQQDLKNKSLAQTVYSGVELEKFNKPNSGKLRKEYSIPKDTPLIVNVAALADHKDHITFVDTIQKVKEKRPGIQALIIGGDQGEEENIRQRIEQLHLQDTVRLTGFRNDIPEVLQEADLFLFTSKTEGLGTSILDAFASGVPVVACRAGGIPELVIHEKTGLSSEVKDSDSLAKQVLRLLNNDALKIQLITQAKEHLQHFSREQTAVNTLQQYEDLLNSQPAP